MLSLDPWNILWTVVNLLVLYVIFKKFLFQPVMKVINDRNDAINQGFENAKKSQEEADKMKEEYNEKLKSAKEDADQIILSAKARAQEEYDKQIELTKAETNKMFEKAKADIAVEQDKAAQEAQSEVARMAVLAARKILETGDIHDAGSTK